MKLQSLVCYFFRRFMLIVIFVAPDYQAEETYECV